MVMSLFIPVMYVHILVYRRDPSWSCLDVLLRYKVVFNFIAVIYGQIYSHMLLNICGVWSSTTLCYDLRRSCRVKPIDSHQIISTEISLNYKYKLYGSLCCLTIVMLIESSCLLSLI